MRLDGSMDVPSLVEFSRLDEAQAARHELAFGDRSPHCVAPFNAMAEVEYCCCRLPPWRLSEARSWSTVRDCHGIL